MVFQILINNNTQLFSCFIDMTDLISVLMFLMLDKFTRHAIFTYYVLEYVFINYLTYEYRVLLYVA